MPKVAIILIGATGSGKSKAANALQEMLPENQCDIYSTNDLFEDDEGNYVYDRSKLSAHHDQNLKDFTASCKAGVPLVICDNLNLRRRERIPYAKAARAEGYVVIEGVVGSLSNPRTLEYYHERSTHGVELTHAYRQASGYEPPGGG
jgi:tRNA uridine 5-carbamoylmethylation protein Kti12